MTKVIRARNCANQLRQHIAAASQVFQAARQRKPNLQVFLVGDNPASKVYVENKAKAAKKSAIDAEVCHFSADCPPKRLLGALEAAAQNDKIDGMLVQLPLPNGFSTNQMLLAIPAAKDVDGLHPLNSGALAESFPKHLIPCTASGCMLLLRQYYPELSGKNAVVVGRSRLVGRPVAQLLVKANCSVTIIHSATPPEQRQFYTRNADILISAVGKPNFITAEDIKPGACLIDVGINTFAGGICGDIDSSIMGKAGAVTPVPGGVGVMTVTMLLLNTLIAAYRRANLDCTSSESLLP